MDWETADTKFQFQVASTNEPSPDKAFDREWAVALLAHVIERLRAECAAEGKATQFEQLKVFLTAGKGAVPHADIAKSLGIDEGAVRVAAHRLRKRFREVFRATIADTVEDAAAV